VIDRTGCAAKRHGDENAYQNARCRCPDARNAQRLYVKRRKLARARGQFGRSDLVPTFLVTRRFRALARMGHSAREVQELAWGYKRSNGTQSWMAKSTMSRERFDRLDAVYQRLSAIPGDNWRAKNYAVRRCWAAPLDWNNIDDPTEVPHNETPEGRVEREREWRREWERTRRRRPTAAKKAAA
jgi:hypothetical protein